MRARLLGLLVVAGCAEPDDALPLDPGDGAAEVTARGETAGSSGDPDDPAIWIDPARPERSRILGTDKEHGLVVYDLSGAVVQDLADGKMNSVDLRAGVVLGDQTLTLVTTGNRSDDTLRFYAMADGLLTRIGPVLGIPTGLTIYGHCMGRDPATGETWVFFDDKDGTLVQWRLGMTDGTITADEVRRLDVGGQVENCVVDDDTGWLFVGEEDVGVWRYGARPETGEARLGIAAVGTGEVAADVEGLAIAAGPDGAGYLVVSSQGDNAYARFARTGDHAFAGRFRIVAGVIDAASESDGIEVTTAALPGYPGGLFVAHDTANEGFTGNFKLVGWDDVVAALD